MGPKMKFLITLIIITLSFSCARASQVTDGDSVYVPASRDSLQISLLTCSPGPEVYALYGHTAIRVVNRSKGTDLIYNYGTFNMSEPNFILKFMLGLLDYELGLMPFERFWMHYSYDGCDITQQELNLTVQEKARMLEYLTENYKPENRGYRYNFLYDNCSTRPRDIIASVIDGTLVWNDEENTSTYRKLMHGCNDPWPWSRLGVDLVLGQSADAPINAREEEFLPVFLQNHLDKAEIHDAEGHVRPAVAETSVFNAVRPLDETAEFILTPMQCVLVLYGFVLALAFIEWKKHKLYWLVDVVFQLAQGVAGILIFILFFFSEHPTVDTNWQIMFFNPVPLLYLPILIYRRCKHLREPYYVIYGGWLLLSMMVGCMVKQDIPWESILAAGVLLIRSLSNLYYDGYLRRGDA